MSELPNRYRITGCLCLWVGIALVGCGEDGSSPPAVAEIPPPQPGPVAASEAVTVPHAPASPEIVAGAADPEVGEDKVTGWTDIAHFQGNKAACESSGGTWRPALLSCACERQQLFFDGRACTAPPATRSVSGSLVVVGETGINIDLTGLAPRQTLRQLASADGVAALLHGVTLPSEQLDYRLTLSSDLAKVLPPLRDLLINDVAFSQLHDMAVPWDPEAAVRGQRRLCEYALDKLTGDASALCAASMASRLAILKNAGLVWGAIDRSGDPAAAAVYTATAVYGDLGLRYRVHTRHFLPVYRHLQVAAASGRLLIMLAATGRIDAAIWQPAEGSDVYFNSKWQVAK